MRLALAARLVLESTSEQEEERWLIDLWTTESFPIPEPSPPQSVSVNYLNVPASYPSHTIVPILSTGSMHLLGLDWYHSAPLLCSRHWLPPAPPRLLHHQLSLVKWIPSRPMTPPWPISSSAPPWLYSPSAPLSSLGHHLGPSSSWIRRRLRGLWLRLSPPPLRFHRAPPRSLWFHPGLLGTRLYLGPATAVSPRTVVFLAPPGSPLSALLPSVGPQVLPLLTPTWCHPLPAPQTPCQSPAPRSPPRPPPAIYSWAIVYSARTVWGA